MLFFGLLGGAFCVIIGVLILLDWVTDKPTRKY